MQLKEAPLSYTRYGRDSYYQASAQQNRHSFTSTQTWDAADWTCAVHCPVGRKSIDQETCYLRRDVSDDIDRAVLTNSMGCW